MASRGEGVLAILLFVTEITGNSVVGFNVEDFEKDFDPAHHEKMMREQFGEDYYGEGMADEEKPQFSDMSDEGTTEVGVVMLNNTFN